MFNMVFFIGFVLVTFSPTVYGGGSGGLEIIPQPTYIQYGIFTLGLCL